MFPQKLSVTDSLSLSVINTDKFKSSVISVSLTTERTPDNMANSLILAGLMRRGTQSLPSMAQLNRALDELYGSYLEIKSSRLYDSLTFSITGEVLDNAYSPDGTDILGGVIDIASELLLHPSFLTSDFSEIFKQEKKLVADTFESARDNPRSYASMRATELLRRSDSGEPTLEALKEATAKATLEGVLEFYRSLLTSSNIDVFYVGSENSEYIKAKLASVFDDHKVKNASDKAKTPKAPTPLPYAFEIEKMPVSQGKLSLGFNTGITVSDGKEAYCTALLLNEIFGGSPASKLFLNVRERMSLCYYCSSSYSIYSGIMLVSSGIEVKNLEIAKNAIITEFEKLKSGEITEFELEAAKRSLTNSYTQLYDSPFDLQAFYSGRMFFGILDGIEDCIAAFSKIKAEDIAALAQRTVLSSAFFVEGTGVPRGEDDNENESEAEEYGE